MILKVLQTEDLLTMINNMRPPPTCSDSNPTGYLPRRMINDETGQHSISADDQFLYAYDVARLYVVICIATSDSLQFLFPESTTCGNGITLWNNIIAKLFGLTYKDAFEAAEKNWSSALIECCPVSSLTIRLGEYPVGLLSEHVGGGRILLIIVSRSSV